MSDYLDVVFTPEPLLKAPIAREGALEDVCNRLKTTFGTLPNSGTEILPDGNVQLYWNMHLLVRHKLFEPGDITRPTGVELSLRHWNAARSHRAKIGARPAGTMYQTVEYELQDDENFAKTAFDLTEALQGKTAGYVTTPLRDPTRLALKDSTSVRRTYALPDGKELILTAIPDAMRVQIDEDTTHFRDVYNIVHLCRDLRWLRHPTY